MLEVIFTIVVIYIIVVFILSRFFIPHLRFFKDKFPEKIPDNMEKVIIDLKAKANSNKEFLELAYNYIGNKYRSERFNTVFKFNYLFKPADEIWKMNGYIPCTQSNFLLRIFLVKSGFYKDKEIKKRHIFTNFALHQYLQVKVGDKWIDVDVGEKQRGLPIGKHLRHFG